MLVTLKSPHSMSSEAYKSLRTSIKYSSIDKQIKTLVVTSSIPGEGKSTVASNLAISFSDSGERVLLIDCDLRKPSIHRKFTISNVKGLTDILIHKEKFEYTIQQINDNLSVLTSGTIPPNPSEIIGSRAFQSFIQVIGTCFDYIILDAPPVLAVTDPQLLAARADGTLLVVRAKKTKGKQVIKAYKELEKVRANIIGSVLNGREKNDTDLYGKYYNENKKIKRK